YFLLLSANEFEIHVIIERYCLLGREIVGHRLKQILGIGGVGSSSGYIRDFRPSLPTLRKADHIAAAFVNFRNVYSRLMMRGAVAVAVSPQSSPRRYGDRKEARGNIRELVGGSGQDPSPGSSPLKPPLQGVCDHQALVSQTGVGLLQPQRPE